MPMSSIRYGPFCSEVEMRSRLFSELNFELQRVLHHNAMDVGHVGGEDRCSSLVTIPGLGVVSDTYYSPQATMDPWQAHKHMKALPGGQSRPISWSAVCEDLWESQAIHVSHISSNYDSAVDIGCTNESDTQEHDFPSVGFDGSPIRNQRFQYDLPDSSTFRPPFVQSLDQAACDTAGDSSWPIGGWYSDVKAVSSAGHSSPCFSRFSHSTSDDISTNSGFVNYCTQQTPVNQSTASIELHLTGLAGHATYPSNPPSASWSLGTMDQGYQSCGNSVSDTSESPRHAKDEFLVQSKQAGMSYREIRVKGQFKEAESTLRGRYRTLTKCREHRVRKPQWHAKDVSPLGLDPP